MSAALNRPAGYSGTPLIKKLGIQPGMRLAILNPPEDYAATLGPLPEGIRQLKGLGREMDFIHYFGSAARRLAAQLPRLKAALAFDGTLWISWPKKAAKVDTDLSDSVVRELGLATGLVDVKVAAVDEVWSGLKFVYRLEDRP